MHSSLLTRPTYKAAVVGAGPAGLAIVGNLLDRLSAEGGRGGEPPSSAMLLWVDPHFCAGRLDRYRSVPSNTKVRLFAKYARECRSFAAEETQDGDSVLGRMERELDLDRGCPLSWAADLCCELTGRLRCARQQQLHCHQGTVQSLRRDARDTTWSIVTDTGAVFHAESVFLATGAHPKTLSSAESGPQTVDLDDALDPAKLATLIGAEDTVAVYGSSHSAMLVLMNLLTARDGCRRVVNFHNSPLKFASFPDPVNRPDCILHDNTGLKGDVADWVRSWTATGACDDESVCDENVFFDGRLLRVCTKTSTAATTDALSQCTKAIYAVGYVANPLPAILCDGDDLSNAIDHLATGQLTVLNKKNEDDCAETALVPTSTPIANLYGFGIAFPERVVDLDGSPEMAVGLWKFMRHIKKALHSMDLRDARVNKD